MISMFLTIINDSRDGNALGRQTTRAMSLFGCAVTTVGVADDLEAAGNLVDALDAGEGREGVVLVNVAPRQENGKKSENGLVGFSRTEVAKKENGSPFGYFYYGKTLVVSSIDGVTLSLVKKLGIADRINVLDIAATGKALAEKGVVDSVIAERMKTTQFRSYEFLPRVAHWITDGQLVVSVEQPILAPDAPKAIWWVDSFGNAKTTLLSDDISFAKDKEVQTLFESLPCFTSLKDVPDGVAAMVIGSSGIGNKRFLEIIVQGENAAERFHFASGSMVV
jgi:hypothetical protein